MKESLKNTIFQAIVGNHWLDIKYINKKKEETRYYFAVKDIDAKNNTLRGDIFNYMKSLDCLDSKTISIEGIQSARIVDKTYYDVSEALYNKITKNKEYIEYLDVFSMENDILKYLSKCYKYDNDPYIKDSVSIPGIDEEELVKRGKLKLSDEQFREILTKVFKADEYDAEEKNRYNELVINVLSIDKNKKSYLVAYKHLTLNFKNKTLKIAENSQINKSFLIDGKKHTLSAYLDMSPNEFSQNFDNCKKEYKEMLISNFHHGEKINTRPSIILMRREFLNGVDETFESIYAMEKEKTLTHPLKSFFGRNRSKGTSKEFDLVVFDKNKINIDQLRVVYNAMSQHTTFVKGPPGTGKTETIFNVLLSAYANNQTVLVCSNNNHPVDDIYSKMSTSLKMLDKDKNEITIPFPIIRLGNFEELKNCLQTLKGFLSIADENDKKHLSESMTEQQKNRSLGEFEKLRDLLELYEDSIETQTKIETLYNMQQIADITGAFQKKIEENIKSLTEKMNNYPSFSDAEVAKFVTSASNDKHFKNFMYYSSLTRIKKLLSPTYKELKDIIMMYDSEDEDSQLNAALAFSKYLKDDVNLRRLLDIFPIVICTNLSCERLGSPTPHFDLCIMDEAGQCNVASSLIPISRADNLLLVGDVNQLQPVTVLELDLNDKFKKDFHVKDDYDYVNNSILSTMLLKDRNSKSILLRYHYRCGKKIVQFVNKRFYEEQLKMLNKYEGKLSYYDVHNVKNSEYRNAYYAEAKSIVDIIKNGNYEDVAIVTPFINQAFLINSLLKKENITNVTASTVHALQGSEKDVIILSSALSLATAKKTMGWIKDNAQLINVGVTRAKKEFIFVGDKEAIDLLSKNDDNDIKALSDYVYSNGDININKSKNVIQTDFSNNSTSEREFFETIQPYFMSRTRKFAIERNVPVKDAIKNIDPQDLKIIGNKEFDLTVKAKSLLKRYYSTIIVFEIDGGEHVGSMLTAQRDRQKERICEKYGIRMIRIPNSRVKDYELIIQLFESLIENVNSIDDVEQISLLDD